MPLKSNVDQYGAVARVVHWSSAFLVIVLLTLGFSSKNSTIDSMKISLLQWHLPLGVALIVLTVFRLFWWSAVDRRPLSVARMPVWQAYASRMVHTLFYVVILALGISGIVLTQQSGAGDILFSGESARLPDFWQFNARYIHAVAGKALFVLVTVHVLAASYHQFIRRDGLMSRMTTRMKKSITQ